jgi:hypothetical protein
MDRRTSHLLFEPVEVLERLAALTPRPRINLVLHHGVLAAHSQWPSDALPAAEGSGLEVAGELVHERVDVVLNAGRVAGREAVLPRRL